jgi:hypothetical protein
MIRPSGLVASSKAPPITVTDADHIGYESSKRSAVHRQIETDTAFEAGRYRHGVKFLRIRAKLQPEDVSILV